ncbi:hypothetical protein [Mucilaginibacter sp.]
MVERLSLFLFGRNPELAMKLKICLLIVGCFIGVGAFAQTAKAIEADLLKSFKQINEWSIDTGINANESLWKAKKTVGEKLYHYTSQYPATITYPFNLLKKEHVAINSSRDGLFRIYSWDTWTGGTMHFFESVFQYKSGATTYATLDTEKQEGDNRPLYNKVYQFRNNNKTYYLAVYEDIGSTIIFGGGIQIFAIEKGELKNIKIIKTHMGLNSELSYDCDLSKSIKTWATMTYPSIHYDELTKTIFIPLVQDNDAVTHRFITYKFTGQYFEKVK